ncbi:MAG: hypothetical protein JWN41_375 [Thermoleophilia bacterium]|nr:hypothetical protein [Thermoleophilia bacterium]
MRRGPRTLHFEGGDTPLMTPMINQISPAVKVLAETAPKSGGGSVIGLLGGTAGIVGLGATLMSTYKDTLGGGNRNVLDSALFSGSSAALVGGVALLGLGESGKVASTLTRNGMRGAGLGLVIGGVVSAVAGAAERYYGKGLDRLAADHLLQHAQNFTTELPDTPAHLEGMAVAYGEAVTRDKKLLDVGMYIEPTTAQQVPAGTEIGAAIGLAHARAQEDDQDRSFAVVQTKDGSYWTARMSGDLDQVDGRNYATGNQLDPYQTPIIGKHQAALQAISGIESVYVFPKGISTSEEAQPTGRVPWLEPKLTAPSGSTTAATTGGHCHAVSDAHNRTSRCRARGRCSRVRGGLDLYRHDSP